VYHAPTGRHVTSGEVRQVVGPAVAGSILSADDDQLVGEPQLRVELYGQKLVVSEASRVEPASTGWRTHRGVDARRLEVSRDADVEPQLVQVVWNATSNVAAERVAYVLVDRLKRVAVRIACSKYRTQNAISTTVLDNPPDKPEPPPGETTLPQTLT